MKNHITGIVGSILVAMLWFVAAVMFVICVVASKNLWYWLPFALCMLAGGFYSFLACWNLKNLLADFDRDFVNN